LPEEDRTRIEDRVCDQEKQGKDCNQGDGRDSSDHVNASLHKCTTEGRLREVELLWRQGDRKYCPIDLDGFHA
jgi:hypothetical protein